MQLRGKKICQSFFLVCVNGSCLAFVIWKTWQCITTYNSHPVGTQLSLEESGGLPFPAITVCGKFGNEWKSFNKTYLENVCNISYFDYITPFHPSWSSNNINCTDSQKVFESIVYKQEDVVKKIQFDYWSSFNSESFTYIQYKDQWNHYDNMKLGRCFTMSPKHEQIKKGIKRISLFIDVNSVIFIHTPGMLVTYPTKKITFFGELLGLYNPFEAVRGNIYSWSLRHELHELKIDYRGENCNDEVQYSRDLCADNFLDKKYLSNVGCTTPFGPNKSKICQNNEVGDYKFLSLNASKYCKFPSKIFTFATKPYESYNYDYLSSALVQIEFEDIIKVTRDYYIYTEISLIAEIGGYVGLFLGVSVNQVTNLMDFITAKIVQLHDNLKL